MDVSKNSGKTPQIIHFDRVFQYFHHPSWGTSIFGNTHTVRISNSTQIPSRERSHSPPVVLTVSTHLLNQLGGEYLFVPSIRNTSVKRPCFIAQCEIPRVYNISSSSTNMQGTKTNLWFKSIHQKYNKNRLLNQKVLQYVLRGNEKKTASQTGSFPPKSVIHVWLMDQRIKSRENICANLTSIMAN